ncbi:hypothetical protein EBB07_29375 [Paenibacillaceae bacterium]|nr:hypothetical protein EBB07_29375 [Paenibacillaceae bacterium]
MIKLLIALMMFTNIGGNTNQEINQVKVAIESVYSDEFATYAVSYLGDEFGHWVVELENEKNLGDEELTKLYKDTFVTIAYSGEQQDPDSVVIVRSYFH